MHSDSSVTCGHANSCGTKKGDRRTLAREFQFIGNEKECLEELG